MPRGVAPGEQGYTPEVMPEDLPRKLTPEYHGGDILGPAIERFAEAAGEKLHRDAAAWAGNQISALRVKVVTDLEQQSQNAPPGDPGDFAGKFLTNFNKSAQPLIESASRNPYAAPMVNKAVTELQGTLFEHAKTLEAAHRVAFQEDSVYQNLKAQLPLLEKHPELADSIHSTFTDQINAMAGEQGRKLKLARFVHDQISLEAATGLARQDPHAVLDGLDNPERAPAALRDLTDEQRETVRAHASKQLVEQRAAQITSVYENAGTTAGARALSAIDKDTNIPDELKPPLRDAVNRDVNQLRAQRREEHAEELATLETRIGLQKADTSDIGAARTLYERGVLSPLEYAALRRGIANSIEAGVDDHANFKAARDAYEKGQGLDPTKKEHKEGVDQLFQALTPNSKPGTPDYANRAVDVVDRVGVVPQSAMDWARTALVSGKPQEAAAAADLVSRINEHNPRAMGFGYEKEIALASNINGAIRSGGDPTVAVDNSRALGVMPKVDTEEFKRAWHQQHADDSQASSLHTALKDNPLFKGGFFSSVPNVPAPMQADYDESTKRYFQLTGDLHRARDLAATDVQRVWGVSQVNGFREVMQYPPEAYGFTASDIRTHLAGVVKDRAASFNVFNPEEGKVAPAEGIKADQLRLVPTEGQYSTARSAGRYWQLTYPDAHGHFQTVYDKDGTPLIYALPLQAKDFDRIRADTHAQAVAQAREWRDQLNEPLITGP